MYRGSRGGYRCRWNASTMWRSGCLLLFIFSECLTTKIRKLEVPRLVRLGAEEVVLDCRYELESDSGLVVKWYFNNALIYQWIKDLAPQARGIFKENLDLTYNASSEPNQQYRALRLQNPTAAFSGEYNCSVSTYDAGEDVQHATMLLFDPGEGPLLSYAELPAAASDDDGLDGVGGARVQLECDASEVFPLPELTIIVDGVVVNQTQTNTAATEGRYNATASAEVAAGRLAGGAALRCDLLLPGADYNNSDTDTYTTYSSGDVVGTTEAEEPAAGSGRSAAVGSGSAWAGAAGGGGRDAGSAALVLAGLLAATHRLALPRRPARA